MCTAIFIVILVLNHSALWNQQERCNEFVFSSLQDFYLPVNPTLYISHFHVSQRNL